MNFSEYFRDKRMNLLFGLAGGVFFSALLFLFGIGMAEIVLLWICYVFLVAAAILRDYQKIRRRVKHLLSVLDALDQKYLLAEIVDRPESALEQVYFAIMKTTLKTMTDEVAGAKRTNDEYRDYIEQWIHEIKVPITGIRLICENNKSDAARKIMTQTELIEDDVERALFYARLGSVEKDYFIREVALRDCVMEVLAQNKQFLIQSGVCIRTDAISDRVYSDDKWLNFVVKQILINSVKYRSSRPPVIEIVSHDNGKHVSLSITDNGIGIRPSELGRVFDKGFVGSNGRSGKKATGIGLYLCSQLCVKLGIDMKIESQLDQFTTVWLYFPKSSYYKV